MTDGNLEQKYSIQHVSNRRTSTLSALMDILGILAVLDIAQY